MSTRINCINFTNGLNSSLQIDHTIRNTINILIIVVNSIFYVNLIRYNSINFYLAIALFYISQV